MKKIHLLLVVIAAIAMLSSCKKDDSSDSTSTTSTTAITNDEAAGVVSMSLAENSMGSTAIIEGSASTASNAAVNPSLAPSPTSIERTPSPYFSKDTTYANVHGSLITYSQTLHFRDTLVSLSPISIHVGYTYEGSYTGPRFVSTHTGAGLYSITTASLTSLSDTLNGTFNRSSNIQILASGVVQKQLSSQTKLTYQNIVLAKGTHKIQSGTATLTFTGTVTNKGDFSYAGSITFEGNDTATLIINGTKYTINLVTGDYTAM